MKWKAWAHGRNQKSRWDFHGSGMLKEKREYTNGGSRDSVLIFFFCHLNSVCVAAAGKEVAIFKRASAPLFSCVG